MSDPIDHHPRCSKPAPVIIRGWDGSLLKQCPTCGRTAPATDPKEST